MKRTPVLILITCLTLSACGSSGGSGSGGQLKMGIAVANISLNFAHEMVEGAEMAAKAASTSNRSGRPTPTARPSSSCSPTSRRPTRTAWC
jgi:hypothetical protein